MQYVGRALGSVSKTWSSLNPATLSGAIDIIVVEQENGDLACSPFHVRFGKFQLLRPSQKKVDFIVNGEMTDLPMKLGDGGEAFFVFETDSYIPPDLQTSPVISPESSPGSSPRMNPSNTTGLQEPDFLDIGDGQETGEPVNLNSPSIIVKSNTESPSPPPSSSASPIRPPTALGSVSPPKLNTENIMMKRSSTVASTTSLARAQEISRKLTKKNIPSKVDANGDVMLDMQGYKSDDKSMVDSDEIIRQLLKDEFGSEVEVANLINKDLHGNIRILATDDSNSLTSDQTQSSSDFASPSSPQSFVSSSSEISDINTDTAFNETSNNDNDNDNDLNKNSNKPNNNNNTNEVDENHYFKTLRLTSEQLKCLSLKYGENDIKFSVNKGKSVISAKLFLWKYSYPIVISDIDGTITKSDALGHVLTMFGRDWTHVGVAKLFCDIKANGYNIMYLTARSVGLADTTRSYLNGVEQDGFKLPAGPVILSPDRTIAALRREIVLKKPEVFKMACLNDIRSLYDLSITHSNDKKGNANIANNDNSRNSTPLSVLGNNSNSDLISNVDVSSSNSPEPVSLGDKLNEAHLPDSGMTPFYAGFGNRITDALSYRTVGVPSSRIFTINPDGDVHMELLELAGYRSSYVSIGELVDQFFPSVKIQQNENGKSIYNNNATAKYTDVNFWREPIMNLSDLSDVEEAEVEEPPKSPVSPSSPRLTSFFSRSPPPQQPPVLTGSSSPKKDQSNTAGRTILDEDEEYNSEDDPEYLDDDGDLNEDSNLEEGDYYDEDEDEDYDEEFDNDMYLDEDETFGEFDDEGEFQEDHNRLRRRIDNNNEASQIEDEEDSM
ncbi:unnamed protein product [[Candida] boidinii]|uniref:Unnamed protein product n=1 Tax=Candida boidinii TaxID=5477 RepID=A0A9W6WIH0_CANBO|nr:unnamed protein product [[Candida] boidinii]